jgi:hypothetical protein
VKLGALVFVVLCCQALFPFPSCDLELNCGGLSSHFRDIGGRVSGGVSIEALGSWRSKVK